MTIDTLDENGSGVCRQTQPVIFVDGALPGELCQIEHEGKKASFYRSTLLKVDKTSESRVTPFCPHYEQCGGCQTQHIEPTFMLEQRQQAIDYKLAKNLNLTSLPWQSPLSVSPIEYRRKARLAIDARNPKQIKIGFKSAQSNRIVAISQCRILTLPLQELLKPIIQLVNSLKHPGNISHISLLAADNVIQLVFRVVKPLGAQDKQALVQFVQQHKVSGIFQRNSGDLEPIIDDQVVPCFDVDDVKLELGADDFVQVNQSVNHLMVKQAMDWLALKPQDRLLDLFCGLGNFSFAAAQYCEQVLGVEGVAEMVEQSKHNGQINGISNASFLHCDLSDSSLWKNEIGQFNKVLLDPSRVGAKQVIEELPYPKLDKVLYVSCNPATFIRDAKHIFDNGLSLSKVGLVDMFPNTSHTEIMGLFESK